MILSSSILIRSVQISEMLYAMYMPLTVFYLLPQALALLYKELSCFWNQGKKLKIVRSWSCYLRIQKWYESPVHREDLGDVAEGRNFFDVAKVEVWVGAGQLAQVFHQRVVVRQIVVNSEMEKKISFNNKEYFKQLFKFFVHLLFNWPFYCLTCSLWTGVTLTDMLVI